ncbi:MAG: glycine cleavage system aminomethyltransferase GcvT [Candidatus Omnitrophica bacterium]|nr:glycine cleavage system aminomethyltransferase GcvT [Candidatus Omnitrophota bacterium]
MNPLELKTTPLIEEHQRLGAKLAPFGGWLMPIQYEGIIAEHAWTRSMCSVFDICHMGEFLVDGDPVQNGLDKVLTGNVSAMAAGTCRYGFMLNEEGGIIDDVIAYRLTKDAWMLVVNAATTDGDEAHLRKHLLPAARLRNISAETAKLDVQGPRSEEILKTMFGREIGKLDYYGFGFFPVCGERNIISRTGYTGERGYEIYVSAGKVNDLWAMLLENKDVKPAGLGARDTLRLEMCYPLYGQDIDSRTGPEEAGLLKFVDLNKDFIGKEQLLQKHRAGIPRKLVCFAAESRRAPRHNYTIHADGRKIGVVTSGSFSPSLTCGIGMGYVDKAFAEAGSRFVLKENTVEIPATVVSKPLYKKGTART